MDNILPIVERVKNSLSLGESHFREFKTALEGKPDNKHPRRVASICQDIGEALVAFTNADGGDLFIGVEDDGSITGLAHSELEIGSMINAVKTHILEPEELPLLRSEIVNIDGKKVLMFSVNKSTTKVFQLPDGRCMQRKDKSSVPISFRNLIYERNEKKSREYDREFVDGASTADLNIGLIQSIANEYMVGISPEQYLLQMTLGEYAMNGIKLRKAAILLFAKDISRWEPRCQVRIVKVNGTKILSGDQYNVLSDEYVTGNILYLLAEAWERLRPYLSERVYFGVDARFEQSYAYPENACREALVNAIAHRDYATQNPIVITFYKDRLEFESPGELLSSISIEDLRTHVGVHESRNTYIARVLRESKFMREMGEGLSRIYDLMESQELSEPELISKNNSFKIVLHHKSVYSQKELDWLKLFEDFELDSDQKKIVIAGIDKKELSPKDIYGAIRTDDRNRYDKCVSGLRVKGIMDEIRSNSAATLLARKNKVNKQAVARFKISIPKDEKEEYNNNKVFVFNLPDKCDSDRLEKEFALFGVVKRVKIATTSNSNGNKGYAYVEFEKIESALKALAIKNIRLDDKIMSIYKFKNGISW